MALGSINSAMVVNRWIPSAIAHDSSSTTKAWPSTDQPSPAANVRFAHCQPWWT